jgi:hypothetical protein
MIPREILKKIRQIELRTNRVVTELAERGYARIPKGFCPKAQGCEERATLGHRPTNVSNRNVVAAILFSSAARGICHNPVGVGDDFIPFTRGSSCVATLGYMPESRWDSRRPTSFVHVNSESAIGNRQFLHDSPRNP